MEARIRTSEYQFSIILEFMERYGDLGKPQQGAQGRLRADRLWQRLTDTLNRAGGGFHKSADKWKKVWADWKTKTKKKALTLRHGGGNRNSKQPLTNFEKRVVAILAKSVTVSQVGAKENRSNGPSQPAGPSPVPQALAEGSRSVSTDFEDSSILDGDASSPPTPPSSSPVLPTPPPVAPQAPDVPLPSTKRRVPPVPSPRSTSPVRRRQVLGGRRRRTETPFERAASEFVAVEQRRLQLEEVRERNLHEREMERLQLESRRNEIQQEHNEVMRYIADVAHAWLSYYRDRS